MIKKRENVMNLFHKIRQYSLLIGCFLSMAILSMGNFSFAASETKGAVAEKTIAEAFQAAPGTNFIRLDGNLYQYAKEKNTIYLNVWEKERASIEEGLKDLAPGTILILNAGSLLLDNPSPHPVAAHAGAGAGAGGASASGGGSTGAGDTAGPNILGAYGFHEYTASDLFGSALLEKVAADGYRFFVKGVIAQGAISKEIQAKRFQKFQKSMGANYILFESIVGNALPTIPAWAASLTPHVVIKDSELKAVMTAFFAWHPEAVAVLDMGTAPYVKDGILTLPQEDLSPYIQGLRITNTKNNITQIGASFLFECGGLTSLDLSPLRNMTQIGHDFLEGCSGLTSLDLSSLRNVTHIGDNFLAYSNRLTSLDLSQLRNVTHIGNGFLVGCTGLTSLDLNPLKNVTQIGQGFLSICNRLTSLDLSPLKNITQLGDDFLEGCSGLTSLDLNPLRNVTQIGHYFLQSCTGLTSLDLSPLRNVTDIGGGFLEGCTGLTSLDLSPLKNVTHFRNNFLYSCTGLTSLDLSPLRNVTDIGVGFLEGCTGLTSLDLSPLRNVTQIGHYFLSNCSSLSTLKGFSRWRNIQTIGFVFLASTPALNAIAPDFDKAPVPDLAALRAGGPRAVAAIRAILSTPEMERFHGAAPGGMTPIRTAFMGAVARRTAHINGFRPAVSAGASAGATAPGVGPTPGGV